LLERNYFKEPADTCVLTPSNVCTNGPLAFNISFTSNCDDLDDSTSPVIPSMLLNVTCPAGVDCNEDSYNITDLTHNDIDCTDPFWGDDKGDGDDVISVGCLSDYCNAKDTATEKAGQIMSIPYLISATMSPVLGFVVDRIGMRAVIAAFAPLVLIAVHLTLALSDASPYLPLIGQGISYSCFAAVLWPSVPYSVPEKSVGTAYGLITAIQNSGLAMFPLIIAMIYKHSDSHYIPWVEIFFVCCACGGVLVGIMLNVVDARTGGKLNAKSVFLDEDNDEEEDEIRQPLTPTLTI